jgi:OOP family OmpA-OmpF porin
MSAHTICKALTGLLGLFAATHSGAQDAIRKDEDRYIGIGGGVASLERDARGAKRGHGLQLLFGWQIADRWNLELSSSYFNFETGDDTMSDFYRSSVGLDLMWVSHLHGWTPYALAGIGGAYNDVFPSEGDHLDVMGNVALGVMSPPLGAYGLRLRAETRYAHDRRAGSPKDLQAMVGIVIPLRRMPEPVVRIETRTVEVVREVIREIAIPAPPPPPLPATPPSPFDSDRDGVEDSRDRCPNTLPGTQVDREGCAMEQAVVILQGVHFETGSARLTSDSLSILTQASAAMQGQPSMRIEVRGHTDSVGKDEYNQTLSSHRAASVMDFLIENGIPRGRLTAVGFGETRPVADNGKPEGRASNRRVEFRVLTR